MPQTTRPRLFLDMDGVLVDFDAEVARLSLEDRRRFAGHYEEVPGIFSRLEPLPGALEAWQRLGELYDIYILSTPPWAVPTAWADKRRWVEQYLGESGRKRLILTHRKDLLVGDYLVDDRSFHGADRFRGSLLLFGSPEWPDWPTVTAFLVAEAARKTPTPPTPSAESLLSLSVAIHDKAALERLTLAAAEVYLASTGWQSDGVMADRHDPAAPPLAHYWRWGRNLLVLPAEHVGDRVEIWAQALASLSAFERRGQLLVYRDLLTGVPVYIGAAAIVERSGRILLLRRIGAPQPGAWGLPGGRPNAGENAAATALRALAKETGLVGRSLGVLGSATADVGGSTWRTTYVRVEAAGEPVLSEPAKHSEWRWCDPADLPSPLFAPLAAWLAAGGTFLP
jgi:ADP-ribose pyrophosphatase YjhB (NUDIX family)